MKAAQPKLMGPDGLPVNRAMLKEQIVTSGLTGIRQAWAPSVASGLTPAKLAKVLRNANEGDLESYLILAEEMEERDPHYASVLSVRKRAVSAVEPVITPASEDAEDVKIADFVREQIEGMTTFPDLVEDALDALGKGFSVIEILWETEASEWKIAEFERCDPRYFTFDRETGKELRLLDETAPVDGLPLDPFKYVVHRPRLKSGLSLRGGLARLVSFSWLCKAYTVKDWIAFIECYGLPLRLGRYGPEATKDDVETLYRAVAGIGTDAAAVLPKSMEIDFQEIADGTGNKVFESFARWADEQISKAVLGQTMTSDNGSSMAQAQVHDKVRHDITSADARQISVTLTRDLVRPIVDLNFGPRGQYPHLNIVVDEPEDVASLVKSVGTLAKQGMRFKASEIRGKLKLSDPDDDDEIFGGSKPVSPSKPPAINRLALHRQQDIDPLDGIEAAGLEDWDEQLDPLIAPVLTMIENAGNYEEALARLPDLISDMDSRKLIEQLMIAMTRARAEGSA